MKIYCILPWILALTLAITSCQDSEKEKLIESGVSIELAKARSENITDLKYDLSFGIPGKQSEKIEARESLTFSLNKKGYGNDLYIDFKEESDFIHKVSANGKQLEIQHLNEHIVIPFQDLQEGWNKIEIEFTAGEMSLNRNEDFLYTLLVPDRARTVFPCFDQPDLKALYTLSLTVPEHWEAVANGPLLSEEKDGAGSKCMHFAETEPLSTYLFSFAAGNFEVETFRNTVQKDPKVSAISIYHRESDPKKVRQLRHIAQEVFKSLEWLENYTGIPYPFAKYDLVLIPGFQFGGMEHSGATLYNAGTMLLPENPSIDQQLKRAHLIAHETAHMWFGDYVTMDWFSGVWIKEVFANFLASLITRPLYPDIDFRITDLNFNIKAYDDDRTPGATTVEQELPNLKYAGLVYNNIIYQKSPIFFNKLYRTIGPDNFQKSIREYLNTYAFGNASWKDLESIFIKNQPEENIGTERDVAAMSQTWIYGKGMPRTEFSLKGKDISTIDQIPNMDGEYYGYIDFDEEALDLIISQLYTREKDGRLHLPAYSRKSALMMLYESWENKKLGSAKYLKALTSYLDEEEDPQLFPMLLSYIRTVADRSIDDPEHTYTDEVRLAEKALFSYMERSSVPQYAKSALMTLSRIVQSPDLLGQIYEIWNDEVRYANIHLNSDDHISLTYELAFRLNNGIRFHPGLTPENILEKEAWNIQNPDKQREFTYISRVCYASDAEMDLLFESLLSPTNRTVEPWACKVLGYLNHPLRQEKALKYIVPGLAEMPEIQETGDIFFPNSWASALLSGHHTEKSREIVERFLEENNDMLPLLRNKILLHI